MRADGGYAAYTRSTDSGTPEFVSEGTVQALAHALQVVRLALAQRTHSLNIPLENLSLSPLWKNTFCQLY